MFSEALIGGIVIFVLTTYLGANSASHYRFATKVIKRWLRSGA